jgi:hypothetical protein
MSGLLGLIELNGGPFDGVVFPQTPLIPDCKDFLVVLGSKNPEVGMTQIKQAWALDRAPQHFRKDGHLYQRSDDLGDRIIYRFVR